MKTKKYRYFLLMVVLLWNMTVYSQQSQDSLNYYSKLVFGTKDYDQLAKAYMFFDDYRQRNLNQKYELGVVHGLMYMGQLEYNLGFYHDSEKTIVDALKILDKIPDDLNVQTYRPFLINLIGKIKRKLDDYEDSLKYYLEALAIAKNKKDSATAYNNIGIAYKYNKRYNLARQNLQKGFELHSQIKNNDREILRSLDNLGFVQAMLGMNDGEPNMLKALDKRKGIKQDVYTSYKHLTEYHAMKGNTAIAKKYGLLGYELALKENNESYLHDALKNIVVRLKDFDYTIEYFDLDEKINRREKDSEVKFAKAKYDLSQSETKATLAELARAKLETRATQSELDRAQSETRARTYLGLAMLILSLLIFTTIILRIRHRKNILMKQFETEQYISKKLHDEVANDVFHNLTKMRKDPAISLELLAALDQVYDKVRDISKAHADLDVNVNFGRLLNDLIVSFKTQRVNIFTKNISKITWEEISETKKKVLYRVLQELMVNMKKHSDASLVTIKFTQKGKKVAIEYIDNGVGSSLEKGSGLRNTESRMELVGGQISFKSEKGNGFQANLIL